MFPILFYCSAVASRRRFLISNARLVPPASFFPRVRRRPSGGLCVATLPSKRRCSQAVVEGLRRRVFFNVARRIGEVAASRSFASSFARRFTNRFASFQRVRRERRASPVFCRRAKSGKNAAARRVDAFAPLYQRNSNQQRPLAEKFVFFLIFFKRLIRRTPPLNYFTQTAVVSSSALADTPPLRRSPPFPPLAFIFIRPAQPAYSPRLSHPLFSFLSFRRRFGSFEIFLRDLGKFWRFLLKKSRNTRTKMLK
jgi:hypothetical protein